MKFYQFFLTHRILYVRKKGSRLLHFALQNVNKQDHFFYKIRHELNSIPLEAIVTSADVADDVTTEDVIHSGKILFFDSTSGL